MKEAFGLPFVVVYGQNRVPDPVHRAAICPGAGGSEIERAIAGGAQVLVTGDISHHQGIDSVARNMAVIDAGHYGLEHIFIDYMAGDVYKRQKLSGVYAIIAYTQGLDSRLRAAGQMNSESGSEDGLSR